MAEGTYEYECMRAELLGLDKPNEDEFLAQQQEKLLHVSHEVAQELEVEADDLKHVSGGLEELHSILSVTQKKLNRFKSAFGSLTNLLKVRVGSGNSSESVAMKEVTDDNTINDEQSSSPPETKIHLSNDIRKEDLETAFEKNNDKLDALIMKADRAEYSLSRQNKQIRSILK